MSSSNSNLPTPKNSLEPTPLSQRAVRLPPWYYRLIITILKPLYRLQVWRRSHQRDNYKQEVDQRFGKQYPAQANISKSTIWCHAVSLGETNTVAPILDALMAKGYHIWLTTTTQTGFARGASRFANDIAKGRMSHSYVPVDSPTVIERFLTHVQPIGALFVETELWANILTQLSRQHIPSILVNGRLSEASFKRYQKIRAVSASMMQNLTLIIAQDDESAQRFGQLGAYTDQIRVTGSLKWVINSPKPASLSSDNPTNDTKSSLETKNKSGVFLNNTHRPIWVAASTHSGEERAAIALHKQLLSNPTMSNSLLIIVPRHPERFDDVAELLKSMQLQVARRSANETVTEQTQVYLADTMGELMHWYKLADVALVGGSLIDVGGHNPVEPASVGTPIVMGTYTQSCQSVVDKLAGIGALYQPNNPAYKAITGNDNPLIKYNLDAQNQPLIAAINLKDTDPMVLIYLQLQSWLTHPKQAKRAGLAAKQLTEQQQAVLPQQLAMIEAVIKQVAVAKSV